MLDILILQIEHPERIRKINKKLVKDINNPKEITEEDKEFISNLDYDRIEIPVQEKGFRKIEVKENICINVFGYDDELVFPIYVSGQKFEGSKDLLLLNDDDNSHYVYIKILTDLCVTKQKIKIKDGSAEIVYSVLVVKIC